jgi:alpha-beta hydrolase superfamily lysophospholipase
MPDVQPARSTATVLTTADGVRLAARWWEPASTNGGAVVLVHGFAAHKDQPAVEELARWLAAAGHAVLTYDSRGHGESDGLCTLGELERLDVAAAVEAGVDRADRVVVVGTSMGGVAVLNHMAAAAAVGDTAGARGAVVVATPAHWQIPRTWRGAASVMITQTGAGRAVAARRFRTRLAVRPARGDPPVERIRAVVRPVAVVHGLDDRFLSPAAATALFTAAREPRRLDLVPGMGHGFCGAALGPVETAVAWVMRTALAGTI